jgi:hypothetical protein
MPETKKAAWASIDPDHMHGCCMDPGPGMPGGLRPLAEARIDSRDVTGRSGGWRDIQRVFVPAYVRGGGERFVGWVF